MSIFFEMWTFFRARKKLWLLPIILTMLLLGGVIMATQGSVVSPIIYTLF